MDKFLEIVTNNSSPNSKLEIVTEGWDHVIIIVDEKQVFRFPKIKSYQDNLYKEKKFLDMFSAQTPILTPRLELHTDLDITYATYPFIRGISFSYAYAETIDEKSLIHIAQNIGEFINTLHGITLEKASEIGLSTMDIISFWPKKEDQLIKLFTPYFNKEQIFQLGKKFDEFINTIQNKSFQLTVNHSDLKPPHIIVRSDLISGIIDFSEVVIGDPAYDFQYLGRYPKIFVDELYKQYPVDEYFKYRQKFYEYLSYFETLESAIKYNRKDIIETALLTLNNVM